MNVKRIVSIALAVLVISFVAPVYANAQGPPPLPHAFYGELEVSTDGETWVPADDGTSVKATGEGIEVPTECNPITTEAGWYGGSAWNDPKLLVQRDVEATTEIEIEFYVSTDGVTWVPAETEPSPVIWDSGEITRVDLAVTIEPPSPPPGGGGGAAAADTTPPRISNTALCPEGVTETTADICWTTHERSTSQVEYWTSPSMLSPLDETLVTQHHVQLTGLTPGTKYYYKTMSMDRRDNLAVSDEYTFTTLGKPPAPAFTTSNLSISPSEVNIGESVTISVLVTNTGNLAGSYEVTLKIDGVAVDSEEVTLAAGDSETVTFTAAKDTAGTYSVDVNGLGRSFTVRPAPIPPAPPPVAPAPPAPPVAPPPTPPPGVNWAIVAPVIAVAVFLAIFLPLRQRRRRAG